MERVDGRTQNNFVRNCNIATLVGVLAAGYGFVEAMRYHNSPENQEFSGFSNSVSLYENRLVEEKVLARVGSIHEIRIPNDPRVSEWGRLKNELDQRYTDRRKSFDSQPGEQLKFYSLIGGLLATAVARSLIFLSKQQEEPAFRRLIS